jgi:TetR/AcrR family transcriptional repressor of nem operon
MARTKDFDEHEVLAKAIQLFWYKGYNGTSMQDLVDGLGISRSSLYDTYTDKHTLFVKALESYQLAGAGKIQAIIDQNLPAKDTVKQLVDLATDGLLDAPHDQQVSEMVCKNDQQMEAAFYQVIKKGQDTGELKNHQDARALARFIFNSVKGMRVTAKSSTDKAVFEDIIRLTVSALD